MDLTRMRPLTGVGVLVLFAACSGSTQAEPQASAAADPEALAVVNGEKITEADLDDKGQIVQLQQQIYQARLEALNTTIENRLIAGEAKRRGVSVEALLDEEVGSKVEAPSDVEVEAFYEQNQARIRAPLEQVRTQVAQLLLSTRADEARGKLVAALRANSEVSVFLDPPRMTVNLDHAPLRGPETAAVTIVEFSDFQCPFCRRVQPTLAEVQKKYGDKIRWSFKDLPLVSIHPDAQKAAEAARCAGEQDKFWEYRAAMFEAAKISSELHEATADKLGLDKPAFDACLQSDRYQAAVQADSDEAQSLGISGTPAFVINGIVLSGAQPLEAFVNVIDAELARGK